MKNIKFGILGICGGILLLIGFAQAENKIEQIPFTSVQFEDGFWKSRQQTTRDTTIKHCLDQCQSRIDRFAIAGGKKQGSYSGLWFDDSDVYKVLEGVSYHLAKNPDPNLSKRLENIVEIIASAQCPDGYLFTPRFFKGNDQEQYYGKSRWSNLIYSHELYCAGHLLEAALAQKQLTGNTSLWQISEKNINIIDQLFGPGKKCDPPGHQEIELALVKLYNDTMDSKWLDLAEFFLEQRGHKKDCRSGLYGKDLQDHLPVVEQTQAVGHAVRLMYQSCAAADIARLKNNNQYRNTLEQLWKDILTAKMYITGGIGSTHESESFGVSYCLPNDTAYAETCASIGMIFWNQRMFLDSGNGKYIDILERELYNVALSGISISGNKFFYTNVLAAGKNEKRIPERQSWHTVPCCPGNLARLIPSIGNYFYAQSDDIIFVNLYSSSKTKVKLKKIYVELQQNTEFPWDGKIEIAVNPEKSSKFAVFLRIPGWSNNECVPGGLYKFTDTAKEIPAVRINDKKVPLKIENGFVRIHRKWKFGDIISLNLPMPVRLVVCDPNVRENNGLIALQRGPIIYCLEQSDNNQNVFDVTVDEKTELKAVFDKEMLGGICVIKGKSNTGEFSAIPYFSWANRQPSAMTVWIKKL